MNFKLTATKKTYYIVGGCSAALALAGALWQLALLLLALGLATVSPALGLAALAYAALSLLGGGAVALAFDRRGGVHA